MYVYIKDALTVEITGFVMFVLAYMFESTADLQKEHLFKNNGNNVCDVGLWYYSRHPNYFGQWMQWNSIIIMSSPAVINMYVYINIYLFSCEKYREIVSLRKKLQANFAIK